MAGTCTSSPLRTRTTSFLICVLSCSIVWPCSCILVDMFFIFTVFRLCFRASGLLTLFQCKVFLASAFPNIFFQYARTCMPRCQHCRPRLAFSRHRGRMPSFELRHQAPPVEQRQLILQMLWSGFKDPWVVLLSNMRRTASSSEKVGSSLTFGLFICCQSQLESQLATALQHHRIRPHEEIKGYCVRWKHRALPEFCCQFDFVFVPVDF